MMYVVAYDIREDNVRTRMASVLGGFGRRVQDSVFECCLEPADLEILMERLARVLTVHDAGNVRLYRICRDCQRYGRGLGKLAEQPGDGTSIVL